MEQRDEIPRACDYAAKAEELQRANDELHDDLAAVLAAKARLQRTLEWLIASQCINWWDGKVQGSVNGVRHWLPAPAEVIEVLTEVDHLESL